MLLTAAGLIRNGLQKSAARKAYARTAEMIRDAAEEDGAVPGRRAAEERVAGGEGCEKESSLYQQLAEMNPDFVCVLRLPVLDLAYPVAASRDNEEYLSRTFEGETSPDGCIFLDCGAGRELEDAHSFIFGHNMQSGAMFGSLKELPSMAAQLEEEPFFYLEQEGRKRRYRIFAFGPVEEDNAAVYRYAGTGEERDAWLAGVRACAVWFDPDAAEEAAGAPVVTLSTCWGNSADRLFMVHGVLTEN